MPRPPNKQKGHSHLPHKCKVCEKLRRLWFLHGFRKALSTLDKEYKGKLVKEFKALRDSLNAEERGAETVGILKDYSADSKK